MICGRFLQQLIFFSLLIISFQFNAQISFSNNAIIRGLVNSGTVGNKLGGVSFLDYDNDGWDDVTIGSKGNENVRFFKNYEGILVEEFLNISAPGHSKQVLWVDYDNDGDNDFFVTRFDGYNMLFQNDGSFNFQDVTSSAGFYTAESLKTYGAAFGDINNDGYLDLFLSNYDNILTLPNLLYLNNGDGTFTNITDSAGIGGLSQPSFCAAFFDYDNDGFQDIYVANDRFPYRNILYRNNQDNTFTDVSTISGTDLYANAMSTTIADYNYDGWLDIYVTNTEEGNHFLKNLGDGTFEDIASENGTTFNSVGWGANFLDADNDTDLDLYVSSDIDDPNSTLLTTGFYERLSDLNYTHLNSEASGFDTDVYKSFANAIGDVNNDGLQDILVANLSPDNHSLWENTNTSGHNWIKVSLEGTTSNKNGIGSWIEIYASNKLLYRYTLCGEGFLGQNSNIQTFGIGDATVVDYIKVKWLSGTEDMITNVSANQKVHIVEGSHPLSNKTFDLRVIKVYPNPSKGTVNIKNMPSSYNLKILDPLGRIVLNQHISEQNTFIDLTKQTKGTYFLSLKGNSFFLNKRIVIVD